MRPPARPVLAASGVSLLLALGGCVSQQEVIAQHEDLLAAAGFVARPATTPERRDMLAHLPPNRFVMREHGDDTVYLYADPIVCGCVYFGSSANYSRYKQERFQQDLVERQQQIADEQQLTASEFSWGGWGWGPWGFGGFGPGFGPAFYGP